VYIANV
jgi:hypothetical protein